MWGGFSLATPEVSGTGRNVELNSVSINNMRNRTSLGLTLDYRLTPVNRL